MVKKILFFVIIFISIVLRVYQISEIPAGLFIDEVNMAVDAKSLIENGTDQYGRSFPFAFEDASDHKLPVYIYLTALSYLIFGPETISIRFPSLIASIGSIFAIFYLAKLLFKDRKYLPYFATMIMGLSPFAIHFGRIGYETMVATFFLIIFLIAFLNSLYNNHRKSMMILAIISILICNWTYPGARFIIPVFVFCIFIIGIFIHFQHLKRKDIVYICGIFLLACIGTFIPSFLNPLLDKRPLNYLTQDLPQSLSLQQKIVTKLMSIFSSYFRIWNLEFLFDKGDLFAYRHGSKEAGIFLQIFSIPYIVGLFIFIKSLTAKNFSVIFLVLFTIIAGLPSSLTSGTPYATRFLPMIIPLTLIIALGMDQIFIFLKTKHFLVRVSIYSLFIVTLLYQIASFSHIYFIHFKTTSLPEYPKAPVSLGKFLNERIKANPNQTIYFLNEKSCRLWSNDALHLWYFADLPSKKMIVWNNLYRKERLAHTDFSPFDAYDQIIIPKYSMGNIHLYSGYIPLNQTPPNSIFVRCGVTLENINEKQEKILKIIYLYEEKMVDPFYIVSQKR